MNLKPLGRLDMPKEYDRQSISLSFDSDMSAAEQRRLRLTRNLFRQFDKVEDLVVRWAPRNTEFRLTTDLIRELHRLAMESVIPDAGEFRKGNVVISTSTHAPPSAESISELVEELCRYTQENWSSKSALHLAAYSLWRLNWIHPFTEGNGITARALAYLILSIRLGAKLPGSATIPAQINENKTEYYGALEQADAAFRVGRIDVSELESMLERMLARQLISERVEAQSGN